MPGRHWDAYEQLELFPDPGERRRSPVTGHAPTGKPPADENPGRIAEGPGALKEALERIRPPRDAEIRYTHNRTVILSLRSDRDGRSVLRAHHCFRHAPPEIAEAAIRLYLTRARSTDRRRWSHMVTLWHQETAAPPPASSREELDHGQHHDLAAILARVNTTWFQGSLDLDVTFGDRIARRLMGRHERRSPRNLVVINPLLDHPWVAIWYLEFLVFHECLHDVHPPRPSGHRMILHPPEFRARERQHPDYERARRYERWLTGTAWPQLRSAAHARSQRTRRSTAAKRTRATSARRNRRGKGSAGAGEP